MSLYQVKVSRKVLKAVEKLPHSVIPKIHGKITSLSKEPRPVGCVKLKGYSNYWRVRVGNYRIIYSVEDQIRIVKIRKVSDRKDSY